MIQKNQTLSDRIRQFRTEMGYSQEFVSKKLNLTQQAYAVIEKNPERASLLRLKEISEILNVELSLLLGMPESPHTTETILKETKTSQIDEFINTQISININFINSLKELQQLIFVSKQLASQHQ